MGFSRGSHHEAPGPALVDTHCPAAAADSDSAKGP